MNKPGPIRHDTSSPEADGPTLPVNTRAAVSYLRVSTKEQAAGGGQYEGFSIPAQRLANQRKASGMGAVIVAEFIDAGESARKADRPQLQAMLEYVREHPISFCIVHKVDRLARNRVDDVEINVALTRAGVKLVSASENIDETPSGMLLHGIMSTIAEFYSRQRRDCGSRANRLQERSKARCARSRVPHHRGG
jgi:site-specific DNA recombinase